MIIKKTAVIFSLLAPFSIPTANAALVFTLQRVDGTHAIMTATGTPGTGLTNGFGFTELVLQGVLDRNNNSSQDVSETGTFVFGTGLSGWVGSSSNMKASGESQQNPFRFQDTDMPSGTASLEIQGGNLEFNHVGSSGLVYGTYQAPTESFRYPIGEWRITAVPDGGSTAILLGISLSGVLLAGNRSKKSRANGEPPHQLMKE